MVPLIGTSSRAEIARLQALRDFFTTTTTTIATLTHPRSRTTHPLLVSIHNEQARNSRAEIARLQALQARSQRWRDVVSDLAVLLLAAGSTVLPGGLVDRLGPVVRAFPALLASFGFWRVAQRPARRWLGSVRGLLRLGGPERDRAEGAEVQPAS